ncbi:hypothetical protein SAMN02745945_02228 [Peptoclostridium litorale DSM 5388]|uniref:Lipoprotein n=1 Tax=Peptoclostridium litorale DSM 5388 TaxID=1121324 RepID=A0A069RNJ3_PEPLI|nr:hypothetical protein [Peptoclostridium litorale]KDR95757.1 hypothetical protein CLIT_10c04840 [Peptoclostridium litorale DSM 5388]SIO21926.1 hypothetical protein SAMN02745945_02228 [Peptoclostridium litorale DSM 5388]
MFKTTLKRAASIVAILLIALLSISGCGSDNKDAESNGKSSSSTSSPATSDSKSSGSESTSKSSASFENWKPFELQPGDFFKYETKVTNEDGSVEEGWFTINVIPEADNLVTVEAAGESGDNSFSFSLTDSSEDAFSKMMVQMMMSPASKHVMSTLYSPFLGRGAFHMALSSGQIKVGNKSSYSSDGHSISTEVVEKKAYAGIEGFVIRSEIDGELESEVCISPNFPLSLMSNIKVENQVFESELVEYLSK